jgi:hypothetical protein
VVTRLFVVIVLAAVALGVGISSLAAWGIATAVVASHGIVGAPGQDGQDGADGIAGIDGQDGAVGGAGVAGPQGQASLRGPAGATGAAGKDGKDGADGADGADAVSTTPITVGPLTGSAIMPINGTAATVLTLAVPSGAFIDTADATFTVTGLASMDGVRCGSPSFDSGYSSMNTNGQSFSLHGIGVHASAVATTILVTCQGYGMYGVPPTSSTIQVSWTGLQVTAYPSS